MSRRRVQVLNSVDVNELMAASERLRYLDAQIKPPAGEPARDWYRIENASRDNTSVYIYDMIGEWGITAMDFVNEVRRISTPHIELRVNTQGGAVFDAMAIYNAILSHPAEVTAYVDGLAASAGSFIVQAADRIIMAETSSMMVHGGQLFVMGGEAELEEALALTRKVNDQIANIYAQRSETDAKTWRKTMRTDTWYNAEEAVAAGLADEVASGNQSNAVDTTTITASAPAPTPEWDIDQFINNVKGAFSS